MLVVLTRMEESICIQGINILICLISLLDQCFISPQRLTSAFGNVSDYRSRSGKFDPGPVPYFHRD